MPQGTLSRFAIHLVEFQDDGAIEFRMMEGKHYDLKMDKRLARNLAVI